MNAPDKNAPGAGDTQPSSPGTLTALVERARAARHHAYAPYSGLAVGAAVLAADGTAFGGCNVENAAYGATVCAERVAVWGAVAAGARRVTAVAVVTPGGGTPCGCCRQVLAELADADTPIAVAGPEGPMTVYRLGDLLPLAWSARDLDREVP